MFRSRFFRLLVIATLSILLIPMSFNAPAAHGEGPDQYAIPEKAELKYPNLGSHLDQLVASVEAGETSAEEAAEDAAIHLAESVAVTIHLSGNVDDVVTFLEDNGGDPRNVGEDYIEAYVPVTLLGELSEQPGVLRVREIVPPEPNFGPITSQGLAAHLADAWHQAGYTGEGIKVGIIDGGFEGFSDLIGTELPTPVEARCYTDVGVFSSSLTDCGDSKHGTAVAETIVDIAPDVELYIARPSSSGDQREVVEWMVSEGVKVLSRSLGSRFDGPGDGSYTHSDSPLKAVDEAVDGGIIWVNSAGNYARGTWFGEYSDANGNGWIEFSGTDAGIDLHPLEAGDRIIVQLRWQGDWGGADRNFDLYVVEDDTDREVVASSKDLQSGGPGHNSYEYLRYEVPSDTEGEVEYDVFVRHVGGSEPDWIQVMVWRAGTIEHYTEHGSINSPSEGKNSGMLAVGAAHWFDLNDIAFYSSRGPTPDGRVKPDIVGTSCIETASSPLRPSPRYGGDCGFPGTSAAAPHVAGMAALVRQRFPDLNPEGVADYLKDHAERRETVPNNTWGYGFAQLPAHDAVLPPPDATVTISPDEVNTGDMVTVSMSDYPPGPIAQIKIGSVSLDLTDPALDISDAVVPSSGQHSFTFVIPAAVGDTPIPLGRVLVEVIGTATPGFDNHASTYITINTVEPGDPCGRTLTGDDSISGEWAEGCDSQAAGRGHARYYTFTLTQESEATITLESEDADTYLYLREGDARSGDYLHQNDDDGGTTRSTIQETLAADHPTGADHPCGETLSRNGSIRTTTTEAPPGPPSRRPWLRAPTPSKPPPTAKERRGASR